MPRFASSNAGVTVGLDESKPNLSALTITSTPASIQTTSRPASVSSAPPPIEEAPTGTEGHRPRRRWTQEEDAKLIAAVNKFGSQRGPGSQWSKISSGLPGRTNKVSSSGGCERDAKHTSRACERGRGDKGGKTACHTASVACAPSFSTHVPCRHSCLPRCFLSHSGG